MWPQCISKQYPEHSIFRNAPIPFLIKKSESALCCATPTECGITGIRTPEAPEFSDSYFSNALLLGHYLTHTDSTNFSCFWNEESGKLEPPQSRRPSTACFGSCWAFWTLKVPVKMRYVRKSQLGKIQGGERPENTKQKKWQVRTNYDARWFSGSSQSCHFCQTLMKSFET